MGLCHWLSLRHRSARFQRRSVWVVFVLLLVLLAVDIAFSKGGHTARPQGDGPDATVFISTLILIYTAFIATHAALLAQVTDAKRARGPWERLILGLMLLAVLVNLWRIQNSVGDLYATTLRRLPSDKVDDAGYEFLHFYFYGNVLVIGLALVVLSWRPGQSTATTAGDQRPG
jgi:hypothetical protein